MKSKNIVSSGLLLLIIILIIVAGSYYFLKRDSVQKSLKEDNTVVDNKDNDENNQFDLRSRLKTIGTYSEFQDYLNKTENVFFVLGRTGCQYCEMYLPVLRSVSGEYDVEIVYVDFSKLSEDDYKGVINSPLMVPSKCTKSGEETPLSEGFGTPLSLFVNSNQVYDCIRGYKDRGSLVEQLKSIGYIE